MNVIREKFASIKDCRHLKGNQLKEFEDVKLFLEDSINADEIVTYDTSLFARKAAL